MLLWLLAPIDVSSESSEQNDRRGVLAARKTHEPGTTAKPPFSPPEAVSA